MSDVYGNNLASDLTPDTVRNASDGEAQTSASAAECCPPAVSGLSRNSATGNATPVPRPEALPAGRELDALVAEKFFGYVWRRSNVTGRRCIYAENRWPEWMDKAADGTEPLVGDWDMDRPFTPAYSTDIAAAWQVVEKIYPDMDLTFGRAKRDDGTVVWWIICAPEDDAEVIEIEAELFPLAIARAALAARATETPEGR